MVGKINIIGQIGSDFETRGVELIDIVEQVQRQKEATSFEVFIDSPGGLVSTGYDIHDFLLLSKKPITTIIGKQCSSIATVVAMAGQIRKMYSDSGFLIHNPWGGVEGDADEIQDYADEIKTAEKKLINFYHLRTGIDKTVLDSLMKVTTDMSASQALSLGFVTEVIPGKAPIQNKSIKITKALAFTKPKNLSTMKKGNNESVLAKLKNTVLAFAAELKGEGDEPKNLDVTLEDDSTVTVVTEADAPAKGDAVVDADGNAVADGTYMLKDGGSIIVKGGVIDEVVAAKVEEPAADLVTANAKIVELEGKLAAQALEIKETVKTVTETMAAIKGSYKPKAATPAPVFGKKADPAKKDEPVNRFAKKPKTEEKK